MYLRDGLTKARVPSSTTRPPLMSSICETEIKRYLNHGWNNPVVIPATESKKTPTLPGSHKGPSPTLMVTVLLLMYAKSEAQPLTQALAPESTAASPSGQSCLHSPTPAAHLVELQDLPQFSFAFETNSTLSLKILLYAIATSHSFSCSFIFKLLNL